MKTASFEIYSVGDSISVHYGEYLGGMLGEKFQVMRRSGDREAQENLNIPKGSNSGDSGRVLEYLKARMDVGNLPSAFYSRPGLEEMPRVDYAGIKVVSVRECGAVGDGVADERTACDKTIRALQPAGGNRLHPFGEGSGSL